MQPKTTITTNLQGTPQHATITTQLSGKTIPGQTRHTTGIIASTASLALTNNSANPWRADTQPNQPISITASPDLGQPAVRIFTGITNNVQGSATSPTLNVSALTPIPRRKDFTIPETVGDSYDMTRPILQAIEALQGPLFNIRRGARHACSMVGEVKQIHGATSFSTPPVLSSYNRKSGVRLTGNTLTATLDPLPDDGIIGSSVVGGWGAQWRIRLSFIKNEPLTIQYTHVGTLWTITYDGQNIVITSGAHTVSFPSKTGDGELHTTESANFTTVRTRFVWMEDGNKIGDQAFQTESQYIITSFETLKLHGGAVIHWLTDYATFTAVHSPNIDLSGITVNAVITGKQDSAWEYLTQAAEQTGGAVGFDHYGRIFFTSRDSLRGFNVPSKKTLDATQLSNLDWETDIDSTADRIVVTYQPNETLTGLQEIVWESPEVIQIGAGKTVTRRFTLEDLAVSQLRAFEQSTASSLESTGSRWIAFSTRTGTSTIPASTALKIEPRIIGTSTIELAISNTTSSTLWIRDSNGEPALWLRAATVTRAAEPQIIELGLPADQAETPYEFDCGTSVQTFDDAQRIAVWLQTLLLQPAPMLHRTGILPDPTLRVGDVIRIHEPKRTGFSTRVLITKSEWSDTPEGPTANVELAVLPSLLGQIPFAGETLGDWINGLLADDPTLTTLGALADKLDAQAQNF